MRLSAIRPYVTTGVALVGASVIVVSPIVPSSEQPTVTYSAAAVTPTSVTEDLALQVAAFAAAGGQSAQALIAALGATPDALARVSQAGIEDPELIPSLLSALVHGVLAQPGPTGQPDLSLTSSLTSPLMIALANALPAPFGFDPAEANPGLLLAAGIRLAEAINAALEVLPNPVPGEAAAQTVDRPEFVAAVTDSLRTLGGAVAQSAFLLAAGLGGAPTIFAAAGEAAIDNPEDIGGLASFLINNILRQPAPDGVPASLTSMVTAPVAIALAQVLPAPLGATIDASGNMIEPGLLLSAGIQLSRAINTGLDLLPDPVSPLPQASVRLAAAPTTEQNVLDGARALAEGLGESGLRLATGAVLAPLGPLSAVANIADGMDANEAIYRTIRNYIDAPLWIADPTIDGFKEVLPDRAEDITNFRDDVLWKTTFNIREPIRKALNVAPGVGDAGESQGTSAQLAIDASDEQRQLTQTDSAEQRQLTETDSAEQRQLTETDSAEQPKLSKSERRAQARADRVEKIKAAKEARAEARAERKAERQEARAERKAAREATKAERQAKKQAKAEARQSEGETG